MKTKLNIHRVLRTICLIAACLLFLSGCSSGITSGEVYEKEFEPAHMETEYRTTVIYTGESVSTALIPYTVYYDDQYVLYIKAFDGENWLTEDFYVPKAVYDAVQIGDMFEYDESRGDLTAEPYTCEKLEDDE